MDGEQNFEQNSTLKEKKTFATDVFTLVGGTVFAQFITILLSPILSRLYSPESFGICEIFTSTVAIFSVIAFFRYEYAIMLPKSEEEAANLFGGCLILLLLVTILTIPLIFFSKTFFLTLIKAPSLEPFLWLIPPTIFVTGLFTLFNFWNSRTKHFARLSIAKVTSSCTLNGVQVSQGLSGNANAGSLIIGFFSGQFFSSILIGILILRENLKLFIKSISLKNIYNVFIVYKKFPLYDTGSALLNGLSWSLPTFLLMYYFGSVIVGYYAYSFRIFLVPMSLIGTAFTQVFFQRATELKKENLNSLVTETFQIFVIIGMIPILIVTIVGTDIFSVIFGQTWAVSGFYAQIMSVYAFVWFVSSPLSILYIVHEKQEFGLLINIANIITRTISIIVGGLLNNPIVAIALFSLSGIIVYGYLSIKMFEYSNVDLLEIIKIILHNFFIFIPIGLCLILLKIINTNSVIIVGISCIMIFIYYFYILKHNETVRNLLIGFWPFKIFLNK